MDEQFDNENYLQEIINAPWSLVDIRRVREVEVLVTNITILGVQIRTRSGHTDNPKYGDKYAILIIQNFYKWTIRRDLIIRGLL